MESKVFDYNEAFSRNIGWVTPEEQNILRSKRIAIAGLGGVGGSHLITLTRLGVGQFNISDMDTFGVENFNRQSGASMATVDQPKLDVLHQQAQAINPELDIRDFPTGVTEENVDEFLEGVDLYVDSLDFFALEARRLLFAKCTEKDIPAITAAPLGMGCAYLGFLPGRMTFEEYFLLAEHDDTEQLIRFLVGLAPARLQNKYLVYPRAVDIPNHKGPSTPMAIETCAGIAGTETLKILLHRGEPLAAPWGMQFDAFRNKLTKTWRPGGNNNPIQKLALMIGRKKFATTPAETEAEEYQPQKTIDKILDIARWAPSGDNAQPWRFEILNESEFVIHGFDTRDEIVYDLQGHASQLAIGALLETIELGATSLGLSVEFSEADESSTGQYKFHAKLTEEENLPIHPLSPYIKVRSVQRRAMDATPLADTEKASLEEALPEGYRIMWFEPRSERWKLTKLLWKNAKLRLTTPEAFPAHKQGIEWNCQYSEEHMPDRSLGIDLLTRKIMRWAMASWKRVAFMNKYFGGTLLPRIQMDLIPNLRCSAHFLIIADKAPSDSNDYFTAGRATQRFWLTATRLGLQLQPAYTPIVFSEYLRNNIQFTQSPKQMALARSMKEDFQGLLGETPVEQCIFMGRIGRGPAAASRSTRLPLARLLRPEASE